MRQLAGIQTQEQSLNLINTPFHFLSVVPQQLKCHGVLLRSIALNNLPVHAESIEEVQMLAEEVLRHNQMVPWDALPENSHRRLEWLLGRIVAKDVLRQWAFETQDIILLLQDIEIVQNTQGKPYILCDKLNDYQMVPDISISHCGYQAYAALSLNGSKIGFDYEDITRRKTLSWITRAFTEGELNLINSRDYKLFVSLWTAKEAAAKSVGLGLMGHWREWQVKNISFDRSVVTINYQGRNFPVRVYDNNPCYFAVCQVNMGLVQN